MSNMDHGSENQTFEAIVAGLQGDMEQARVTSELAKDEQLQRVLWLVHCEISDKAAAQEIREHFLGYIASKKGFEPEHCDEAFRELEKPLIGMRLYGEA